MGNRKNIGLVAAVSVGVLILVSSDLNQGTPIAASDCGSIDQTTRQVSCFEVPVEGAILGVVVIHNDAEPLASAPVLVLPSFPGETPSADLARYAELPLARDHDIVLVDPRGGGRSSPQIDCPDLETDPSSLEMLQRCREDITDAGTDLTRLGTATRVNDLEQVRDALSQGRSWRRWHVAGVGYGSQVGVRLAQTHARGVASLTLSSVIPLHQGSIAAAAHAFAPALDGISAVCSGQRACARLGNTAEAAFRIAQRLDTRPEPLELPKLDGSDRAGVVAFDGSMARNTLSRALLDESLVSLLPWALNRIDAAASEFGLAAAGQDTLIGLAAATRIGAPVADALFWAAVCAEQVPTMDSAALAEAFAAAPELVAPMPPAEACEVWSASPAEPAPIGAGVTVPTLIFTSRLDPRSIRGWADEVGGEIEGSVVVEVIASGWTPGATNCTAQMMATFMAGSAPSTACAEDPLDFETRPVPVAGFRFDSVADEIGAITLMALGTTLAFIFTAWIWTGPYGSAAVAWTATTGVSVLFLVLTAASLTFADAPSRLVAQSALTWPVFMLAWLTPPIALFAGFLTGRALLAGTLPAPWPARYFTLAIGVLTAWTGAAIAGLIPGA